MRHHQHVAGGEFTKRLAELGTIGLAPLATSRNTFAAPGVAKRCDLRRLRPSIPVRSLSWSIMHICFAQEKGRQFNRLASVHNS